MITTVGSEDWERVPKLGGRLAGVEKVEAPFSGAPQSPTAAGFGVAASASKHGKPPMVLNKNNTAIEDNSTLNRVHGIE